MFLKGERRYPSRSDKSFLLTSAQRYALYHSAVSEIANFRYKVMHSIGVDSSECWQVYSTVQDVTVSTESLETLQKENQIYLDGGLFVFSSLRFVSPRSLRFVSSFSLVCSDPIAVLFISFCQESFTVVALTFKSYVHTI